MGKGLGLVAGVTLAMTSVLLSGCGGGAGVTLPDPTVQFVHASPDVGNVDFYLNAEQEAGPLAYLRSNNAFRSIEFRNEEDQDSYDVYAREANGVLEFDAIARVFERNTHSLVVLFGLLNPQQDELEKRARVEIIEVDRLRPVGNRARLIVFHGFNRESGKQTPSVDFKNPGDNPLFALNNIGYGTSEVITVDAGTNVWAVERSDSDANLAYAQAELTFEPGRLYFVVISGVENATDPSQEPSITVFPLSTI